MKRIMSLVLSFVLIINLIQVNLVSYAKEFDTTNIDNDSYVKTIDDSEVNSVLANDMTISSTNSIGTMLQNELTDVVEEQEQNNGYNVFSVEMEGTVANVAYEATEDCQLIVSIYDNEGNQMLSSGTRSVFATDTEATVDISIDSMPEYFYIRAYLVEEDTLMPLCTEFESNLYTQVMQEFLAKTPEDFDSEKVLEVEEESNSFVVFNDTTKMIPYNDGYNTIEQMDETNREYIIANPDENFTALQVGDVFSYEYEDGQVLIVDIVAIENVDGKLVIVGDDADMDDVFDYVRIDTGFAMADSTVDASTCDENVTYLGRTTGEEQTAAYNLNRSKVDGTVSSGDELKISDKFEVGKKDSNDNPIGFHGIIDFKATGELKIYEAPGAEYIELKLTVTVKGTVEFTEKFEDEIKLACLGFSPAPGIYMEFTPKIIFEVEAAIKYEAEVKFIIGVRGDKDGIKNISQKPEVTHKLTAEGKVYIGISLAPKFKIVDDKVFNVSCTAKAGVEFKLESSDIYTNEEKGIQHDCVDCFEGDATFKLDLSAELELFGVDWFTFKKEFLNVKIKISDMYASPSKGEFGFKQCPHVKYKIFATTFDENYFPVEGVVFCGEHTTDVYGNAEFYLPRGKHKMSASKPGYVIEFETPEIVEITDRQKLVSVIATPIEGAVVISEETFPDENFRDEIAYWCDSNRDGVFSIEEIEKVTRIIFIDDCDIYSLAGIEYFFNLEQLNCAGNQLTTLDLSNNPKLWDLNCADNQLTTLDISNNSNLANLDCGNNKLVTLDVNNNLKLGNLYCYNNGLTTLDVSNNSNLLKLGCGNNQLTTLDINNNSALVELDCGNNQLTTLDVVNNLKLVNLFCDNNSLTTLDVSNNVNLGDLVCSNNQLVSLDVSNQPDLWYLGCNNNDLSLLDVSNNLSLQGLDCESNNLTILDVSNNSKLESLYCRNNNLTTLYLPGDIRNLNCDNDVELIYHSSSSNITTNLSRMEGIIETPSAMTTANSNTYKDESPEALLGADLIVSIATDAENSYTGLYPNEVYNFYVFKDSPEDIPFGSVFTENNLLYVKQYVSDESGSLDVVYTPTSDNTDATEILVCAQKIDIANGYEINIDDLTYTGEKQTPTLYLYVHDELLVKGEDYYVEGDLVVSEIGEYTITLVGIGKYRGTVDISFAVEEGTVFVTDIVLDQTSLEFLIGEEAVLTATITPDDATEPSVRWSSSDTTVAKVDENGNVVAVGEGTADIVAQAVDGSGVEEKCIVTVTKKQETTQQPSEPQPDPEQPTTQKPSESQPDPEQPTTQKPSEPQPDSEQPSTQQPTETEILPTVGTTTTLSSGQYKVTKSTSSSKEVTYVKPKSSKKTSVSIPATVKIDGYTYNVTEIAAKAFKNNKSIKTVTIGKNAKKIGNEAFSGCKNLKKVTIGKSVTTIGKKAFYNCKKLKTITIKSSSLKSVGKNAIKNIDKKATIKVPKSRLKKYKSLFKSKTGYKKTMKIKK